MLIKHALPHNTRVLRDYTHTHTHTHCFSGNKNANKISMKRRKNKKKKTEQQFFELKEGIHRHTEWAAERETEGERVQNK